MSKRRLVIGSICVLVVVCLIAGGVFALKNTINTKNETTDQGTQTSPETIEKATANQVNAVPLTTEVQPAELTELLKESGYTFDDLKNTRQLIIVTADNGEYYLECYECKDQTWKSTGIKAKAFVGKNGTISVDKKSEGDYYSPQGLYGIGFAFGKNKNPGTKMEYRDIHEGVYWVDDPESELYNKWVDSETQKGQWNSAEKMWSYDEYIYGAVINYNTDPIVKDKGSAIFLHVGYKYTAGCIASDEGTIISILKWLNPQYNPKILIN